MRKFLLFLVLSVLVLAFPLSISGSAQEEGDQPEPTAEGGEDEDDPNIIERVAECFKELNPAKIDVCLGKATVPEVEQEAVDVASVSALSAWSLFVQEFLGSAMAFLYDVTNWWVDQPSIINDQSLVDTFQNQFTWLAGLMVVGGIVWQGTRVIYQRKPEGFGVALSAVFKFAVISAGGYTIITELSAATDEWAASIVSENADSLNTAINDNESGLNVLLDTNPNLAFILAIFLIFGGIAQTILFVLRDLSLLVMTGFLVFAASGQFFDFSRSWLGKVISPILAILFYKPLAALIMKIALDLILGETTFGFVAGTAMVFLSAFSVKPFMKIFAVFTPEGITPWGSGGGVGFGGAAMGMGAVALGSGIGRGSGDSGSGSSEDSGPPKVTFQSAADGTTAATRSAPQLAAPVSSANAAAGGSGAAAGAGPAGVGVMAAEKSVEGTQLEGDRMGKTMSGEE